MLRGCGGCSGRPAMWLSAAGLKVRHPDESQDPGLKAVRFMALDPDFRQDDGGLVLVSPDADRFRSPPDVFGGREADILKDRAGRPPSRAAVVKARFQRPGCRHLISKPLRHPDESQDPGLQAVRFVTLSPDVRQDDGKALAFVRLVAQRLAAAGNGRRAKRPRPGALRPAGQW